MKNHHQIGQSNYQDRKREYVLLFHCDCTKFANHCFGITTELNCKFLTID